jgi:hypothetical protein
VRRESGPTDQLDQFVDDQRFDIFSDSTVERLFDADHPESDNLRNLRPRKRLYPVDGSIAVGVKLASIERQKHIPEQLRAILILN